MAKPLTAHVRLGQFVHRGVIIPSLLLHRIPEGVGARVFDHNLGIGVKTVAAAEEHAGRVEVYVGDDGVPGIRVARVADAARDRVVRAAGLGDRPPIAELKAGVRDGGGRRRRGRRGGRDSRWEWCLDGVWESDCGEPGRLWAGGGEEGEERGGEEGKAGGEHVGLGRLAEFLSVDDLVSRGSLSIEGLL